VFGVGNGVVTPTLFADVSALAPDHVRAGVTSLQTTTVGASQVVGPALFTFLSGLVGYQWTLVGGGLRGRGRSGRTRHRRARPLTGRGFYSVAAA
jgi:MFS family permease